MSHSEVFGASCFYPLRNRHCGIGERGDGIRKRGGAVVPIGNPGKCDEGNTIRCANLHAGNQRRCFFRSIKAKNHPVLAVSLEVTNSHHPSDIILGNFATQQNNPCGDNGRDYKTSQQNAAPHAPRSSGECPIQGALDLSLHYQFATLSSRDPTQTDRPCAQARCRGNGSPLPFRFALRRPFRQ
jgi:hypothetical protein